jgi:probable HAF family extracellular repeat protein
MLAWLAPASAADAPHFRALTPTYTITDIGLLHEGDNGYGRALNILGEVVGSMASGSGDWRAFLYRRGQLVAPVGPSSFATAINAQSQIIGWFDTLLNPGYLYDARHHRLQRFKFIPVAINNLGQVLLSGSPPLLYQPDGTLVDLGPLLGPDATVSAINDLGQIAGSRGDGHAFLTQPGGREPKDLGALSEGGYMVVTDLNEVGQAVGYGSVPTPGNPGDPVDMVQHAFLYAGGKLHDLGTLGSGQASEAHGINNLGQVVGWSATSPRGFLHGWIYWHGQMYDLNRLLSQSAQSWTVTEADGINDLGQIAGTAFSPDPSNISSMHPVRLSPHYQ